MWNEERGEKHMSETDKEHERVTNEKGSTSPQSAGNKNESAQEPRGEGGAEVKPCPSNQCKTGDNKKDPYEHLKTTIAGWALFISGCALAVSFFSCYSSKRSADTAELALTTVQRAFVSLKNI